MKGPTRVSNIEQRWEDSDLYNNAKTAYYKRVGLNLNAEPFYLSEEFRNARYAFRKTVNGSWGKEST